MLLFENIKVKNINQERSEWIRWMLVHLLEINQLEEKLICEAGFLRWTSTWWPCVRNVHVWQVNLNFQQNAQFYPINEDNLFVKLILLASNSCSVSLLTEFDTNWTILLGDSSCNFGNIFSSRSSRHQINSTLAISLIDQCYITKPS